MKMKSNARKLRVYRKKALSPHSSIRTCIGLFHAVITIHAAVLAPRFQSEAINHINFYVNFELAKKNRPSHSQPLERHQR